MPGVNKSRVNPRLLRDLCDDLAVEVDLTMRQRGLRIADLGTQYGYCDSAVKKISAWLRGADSQVHPGHLLVLGLAEKLDIPIAVRVGDEARDLAA